MELGDEEEAQIKKALDEVEADIKRRINIRNSVSAACRGLFAIVACSCLFVHECSLQMFVYDCGLQLFA